MKNALKRLAASDLSFFETIFRNRTYGDHRQKGINLNTDPFVTEFYPEALVTMRPGCDVLVSFFGPAGAPVWSPPGNTRPITYNNAKNWRLNGGTIPDDASIPDRFERLAPGDLALLRFRGATVPEEVDVILIEQGPDGDLFRVFDPLVARSGHRTMVSLSDERLRKVLTDASLTIDLPWLVEGTEGLGAEEIEGLALGGATIGPSFRRTGGRRLTPAEMLAAKRAAEALGTDGEVLLNGWLGAQQAQGRISALDWVSQRDAASPFDFRFEDERGDVRMDAKATSGPFERDIHLSFGEVIQAADTAVAYDIARLYEVSETGAKMRIARGIGDLARTLERTALPLGAAIDSFRLKVRSISWGPEIEIERPSSPVAEAGPPYSAATQS